MNADNIHSSTEYLRDQGGRFLAGAGNPGRKVGSRNRATREAIEKIKTLTDEAFIALAENVRKRDQRAVEFILSKVLPEGRLVEIDATGDGIHEAVTAGDLSVAEIRAISAAVANLKKIDEIDSLRAEVDQLRKFLEG